MFVNVLLLAAAFEVLPFYQQNPRADFVALRPIWSQQAETTDVLWPLFTAHRDWWRFCFFTHYQSYPNDGYQFEILPLWFNGRPSADEEAYWGLFPLWGHHPHFLMMYDLDFCLWPLWTRYRMPRPSEKKWMTSNAILWPLFHWRDDGSWGLWPLYVTGHNRTDDHTTVLWPLWNWKTCYPDRDTAGAGRAWMFWPLCGGVKREREEQWLFLPPLFSHVETASGWRGRYPIPLVEIERFTNRSRTSVFPFYEKIVNLAYKDGAETGVIYRFGWRLVEILPEETRVFPFYVGGSRSDAYTRVWPFYEAESRPDGRRYSRFLSLFPIRWVPAVDRNWAKFWTFYETESNPVATYHSLLWGLIRWRTIND